MNLYYRLDAQHNAIPCSLEEYALQYQPDDPYKRHVGDDTVEGIRISTVFLGIDHSFGGVPILFETMIFGGVHDDYQERYCTWIEALAGHKRAVELVNETLNNKQL